MLLSPLTNLASNKIIHRENGEKNENAIERCVWTTTATHQPDGFVARLAKGFFTVSIRAYSRINNSHYIPVLFLLCAFTGNEHADTKTSICIYLLFIYLLFRWCVLRRAECEKLHPGRICFVFVACVKCTKRANNAIDNE